MDLNSRRGASAPQRDRDIMAYAERLLQCAVVVITAVVALGYYHFLYSTVSAGISNGGGEGVRGSIAVGGSGNKANVAPIAVSKASDARSDHDHPVVGYAVTVSGCPKAGSKGDFGAGISDGAAVLKHSIHLNSVRSNDATRKSRYDYKMYALVHPGAEPCARTALEPLGFEILLRDVPVPLEEIEGEFLRTKVASNGCCGEKEFVKLHAYTLVDHPVVVHLDLDTLVLKPMDALYDAMIDGAPKDGSSGGIDVAYGDPLVPPTAADKEINAFFTRDYNMAHRGMKHVGAQGGFLVLRPSMDVYNEFVAIIRKGDFQNGKGWGGLGFGPFYGVSRLDHIYGLTWFRTFLT